MWNNHQFLNLLSNLLYVSVAAAAAYVIGLRLIEPPYFPIKEINIFAAHAEKNAGTRLINISEEQIQTLFTEGIKGNFVSVDLTEVRNVFEKLPWVREAKINRKWPNALDVIVEEHQALARWDSHALVNTFGEVFRVSSEQQLPVFLGPTEESAQEVAKQFHQFNQILKPLQQNTVEVVLTPRYAWRIRLNTGTVLELGREDIKERLERYVLVYEHSIARLSQDSPLEYVDLRYPNGFAVRLTEQKQQTPKKSNLKKET